MWDRQQQQQQQYLPSPEGLLPAPLLRLLQGTDLEMRRARSRGGTGLGLSICSKQVGGGRALTRWLC